MLDGMVRMAPTAEVGFLGMIRDDETLNIVTYAERLPKDLTGRHVFLLDRCWQRVAHWPKPVASCISAMHDKFGDLFAGSPEGLQPARASQRY